MHERREHPLRQDLPAEWVDSERGLQVMVGTLALNSHPEGIGLADLRYELSEGEGDDSVDRAVEAMVAEGLLRRDGETVFLASLPPRVRVVPLAPPRNGAGPRPRRQS